MKSISLARQTGYSFAGILLFFLLLEGAAFVAKPLYRTEDRQSAVFQSRYDDKKKLEIAALAKSEVASSVTINITDNFLTSPDPDLIFHVSKNPEHRVIHDYTGINADGHRGDDFDDATFADDAHKVMIIGDSCAFGWGLPDYNQTWQAQLEKKLKEEPIPYRVMNFGQPGYSSYQGRLIFERWFDKVKPDTLVIYFGWNDIWSTPLLTDRQTIVMMKISNNPLVTWFFSTNTYALLRAAIRKGLAAMGHQWAETYAGAGKIRVPMNEALENFAVFVNRATAAGAKVIILGPPFESRQFHRAHLMPDYIATLFDAYSDKAIFAPLRPLRHYNLTARDYFLGDGFHPNRKGAAVIADELTEIISGRSSGASDTRFLEKVETIAASDMPKIAGENVEDPTTLSGSGKARKAVKGVTGEADIIFGPYRPYNIGGDYRARFRLKAERIDKGPIATIDVVGKVGAKYFTHRVLTDADFPREGEWYNFDLPFTLPEGGMNHIETRVHYKGNADLSVDVIMLFQPLTRTVPGTPKVVLVTGGDTSPPGPSTP